MKKNGSKTGVLCLFMLFLAVILGSGFFAPRIVRAAGTDKYVIVLDAGHGGSDSGALQSNGETIISGGIKESEVTLKIAKYIKEELAKYPNIEVVMTRETNTYVYLADRVRAAYNCNADLLVSLHIDSSNSSSPSGASLLISNGNYHSELAAKEKIFGGYLKEEFSDIGVPWRGYVIRNSEDGSKYPNGKTRDYYAIVSGSVESNLPGVIVEHCFLSNPSDVSKYLSSNARIRKLALADANAIVKYCQTVEKVPERTGWVYQDGAYYYFKDGTIVKNQIIKDSDGIFYVNEEGKRVKGWQTVNGKTYYFNTSTGSATLGWKTIDKKKYYFSSKSGVMFQNILNTNAAGVTRYFGTDGALAISKWVNYNGNTYYCNKNGVALKGFASVRGKIYYFSTKSAYLVRNKKLTSSKGLIYYIDANGLRVNDRFVTLIEKSKKYTYYFGSDGAAYTGWKVINGNRYYFSKSGKMAQNQSLTNAKGTVSVFDENGVLVKQYKK